VRRRLADKKNYADKGGNMKKKQLKDERREFLAVAGKFSTVVAALGLSGTVSVDLASAADQESALKLLLRQAIDTGNMEAAIERYGGEAKLDKNQLAALRSLTPNELAVLKRIRQKLAPHQQLKGVLRIDL